MKLTRKQLRKLIEARIKPTTTIPGMNPRRQENLNTLAAARGEDSMGRKYGDRSFDSLIGPFTGDDVPFSQREFEYDYPMVEDPRFVKGIKELFDMFMYENKVFAGDIEEGMSLEEYKEVVTDDFIENLPQIATKSENPAVRHTFSSGELHYRLEDIIKRIVYPVAESVWRDWSSYFANN